MLDPTGHRLVFVGGLHRSGTTPLARVLAEHPQVSGFRQTGVTEDEGQHLQDVYPPARTFGGAGRFALRSEAHLTEQSPLVTPANAERLLAAWRPFWDLDRPVLVEKSPPNLVMTRFLQALFPDASFVVIVRHPVVVALSTKKWLHGRTLRTPLENWFAAHGTFAGDAPHLRRLHVVKYEDLVRDPHRELAAVGEFLGLDGEVPTDSWQGRSGSYAAAWEAMAHDRLPWRRLERRALVRRFAAPAREYGYDVEDLDAVGPWPARADGRPTG